MPSIKVINGALDVIEIDGEEIMAIRGVIDPQSLQHIQTPDYQREILSPKKIAALKEALLNGRVPDIDLGMRGESVMEREGVFYLQDPVFVIDGLQRKTAAFEMVQSGAGNPHIGALIHIGTTENWERKRFEDLNLGQTGLSNNVTLRNMAKSHDGAGVMLRVSQDRGFVLHRKITWGQQMARGDLITAITFYKVVGRLHSHAGPGKGGVRDIAKGLDKIIKNVGKNNFMHNVRQFFALVDETFGVANVAYRNTAVQLKSSFLLALAGIVSDHESFWEGDKLEVPAHIKKKLATFPITDPHVGQLAGSAGKASFLLEQMLIEHINAGKRTRRLKKRSGLGDEEFDEFDEDGDE